jgi:hypothetical protein
MAQRSLQPQLFRVSLIGTLSKWWSTEINNHLLPAVTISGTCPASLVHTHGKWVAWSDGFYTREIELSSQQYARDWHFRAAIHQV